MKSNSLYNLLPYLKTSYKFILILIFGFLYISCKVEIEPPIAMIAPDTTRIHGTELIDNYAWLKDKTRQNPQVLDYIKAENNYTSKKMQHNKKIQQTLFKEFISRIKENDVSVPVKKDNYFYYSRKLANKQYQIYCRKKWSLDAEEEIYLDINEAAEGYDFYSIIELKVSPDHRYLSYGEDTSGSENYKLVVKDLKTNEILSDTVEGIGDIAWANDNLTIFYTTEDEAGRTNKVYKHVLGTDIVEDELMFEDKDERFWVWVSRSRNKKQIILGSASKTTTEFWLLDADNPNTNFKIAQPRIQDLQYDIFPHGEQAFILTNYKAENFRIMKAPLNDLSIGNWQEVLPHRDSVSIQLDVYDGYLAVKERTNGINKLRIIDIDSMKDHYVEFPDPIYSFYIWNTCFYDNVLRYTYESLTSPYSIYDLNLKDHTKQLKKVQFISEDFNSDNYTSERVFAIADDGTKIPISLVYNKKLFTGVNPLNLTAYGAYGDNFDPYFSTTRLSLLDRGIVYAIAHVRGGKERGEKWYEQGKMLNKKNTFTDFISCAEFLKDNNYTDKIVIDGGSAGGLLIGAVMNMRPELFHGVIADVPFVDVLNTMLDPTLSAVVSEYEEWGNPNDKIYFDYIHSYSPYDNVKKQDYPNLLVLAGFYDTRVNYWEPAKWVAKLRANKTNDNLLLLQTNMNAGHGGSSGRYDYLKEIALTQAFILNILEIKE